MKILHIANSESRYLGLRYYGFPRKIHNGLVRNGHCVELFCDRDAARAGNLFGSRKLGVRKANKALVDTVENFGPELILLSHADIISERTLLDIRATCPAVPIAQYNVDPLFMKEIAAKVLSKNRAIDVNFMTTAGPTLAQVAPPGGFACYIPNPVDASIETAQAFANDDMRYEIFFAFGDMAEEPDRYAITAAIAKQLPDVRQGIFEHKKGQGLFGSQYVSTLARSRIGLNLSRGMLHSRTLSAQDLYLYSSDRISHYMGNGLLTLTHRKFALSELFADNELVIYDNTADLLVKIRHFLANDNELRAVAKAGWSRYHSVFNERLVAKYMVEVATGERLSESYAWPTDRFYN